MLHEMTTNNQPLEWSGGHVLYLKNPALEPAAQKLRRGTTAALSLSASSFRRASSDHIPRPQFRAALLYLPLPHCSLDCCTFPPSDAARPQDGSRIALDFGCSETGSPSNSGDPGGFQDRW